MGAQTGLDLCGDCVASPATRQAAVVRVSETTVASAPPAIVLAGVSPNADSLVVGLGKMPNSRGGAGQPRLTLACGWPGANGRK